MILDLYFIAHTKINTKWIKELNLRAKATELSEENKRENFRDPGFGNSFLNRAPKAQAKRKQINK